jgi:multidrug efflux pump subunit AcrA (membrane-fusion protein)
MMKFLALLVLALVPTCLAAEPATKPAGPPIAVPATIEAFEQVDLYARASGYISAVNYDIGDRVEHKKVLAVIDQPELEKDLAEAAATATAKQKLVESAAAAMKQAEQGLEIAKRMVAKYQADERLQKSTLQRQQELYAGKAITDQAIDEAKNRFAIAEADAAIAHAKVAAAEADLASAKASKEVAAAQAEVAAAQVGKIEALREYLQIKMPFDGTIARRFINRGDLAQAASGRGSPLFTVQQTKVVRVRCDVPQAVAGRIAKETPAVVKVEGVPEPIVTTVSRVAGALNPETRTMRVEIDLPNGDGRLLPGAYAIVTLTPVAVAEKK